MGKIGKKPDFSGFLGFWTPPGGPRGALAQGFYINPSRRGPAVPAGDRQGWRPP